MAAHSRSKSRKCSPLVNGTDAAGRVRAIEVERDVVGPPHKGR